MLTENTNQRFAKEAKIQSRKGSRVKAHAEALNSKKSSELNGHCSVKRKLNHFYFFLEKKVVEKDIRVFLENT